MEKNRPVTIFAVITLVVVCAAGVLASVIMTPDAPVRTSLLTLAVILGGVAAIAGIHFLMFVPLLTIIAKLCGKKTESEKAGL